MGVARALFDEAKHPRGYGGKFASKGGSAREKMKTGEKTVAAASGSLAAAARSGVKSREELPSGSAKIGTVTFKNGTKAFHKVWRGKKAKQEADAAQLAGSVAKALGVTTPAVHRVGPHEAYMDLVSGPTAYHDPRITQDVIPSLAADPQGRRLGLFDLLVDYDDRSNRENWMVSNGRLVALDHDSAWDSTRDPTKPPQESWAVSAFSKQFISGKTWKTGAVSEQDYTAIRNVLDGLRPQFEKAGRSDWYSFMTRRLDAMAGKAG